jgi:hypothetical protein
MQILGTHREKIIHTVGGDRQLTSVTIDRASFIHVMRNYLDVNKYDIKPLRTKLRGFSPQTNYTDRATALVGEVSSNFADRGRRVVSATDPHGR